MRDVVFPEKGVAWERNAISDFSCVKIMENERTGHNVHPGVDERLPSLRRQWYKLLEHVQFE